MQTPTILIDAARETPMNPIIEWFSTGPELPVAIALIILTLVVSRLVEFISLHYLKRTVENSSFRFDDVVFDELHTPLFWTIVIVGFYLALLPLTGLSEYLGPIEGIVVTVLVLLWTRTLIRLGSRLGSGEASRSYGDDMDFIPIFQNIWTIIVLVAGAFMVLTIWDISITPLLASAGIAGIAIGFAAQDTVANFFGALALYFDDTYKVGDYIELDTGTHGVVEEVSIRSTVVRTRDDLLVTVPNSVLNSAVVTNQSAPDPYRRIRVAVSVAYGTDIDVVEEILTKVAKSTELVVDEPQFEPRVRFQQFGSDGLEYELRCWVPHPDRRGAATHHLNRAIYTALDEANIEIPFPQRDVRFRRDGVSKHQSKK